MTPDPFLIADEDDDWDDEWDDEMSGAYHDRDEGLKTEGEHG